MKLLSYFLIMLWFCAMLSIAIPIVRGETETYKVNTAVNLQYICTLNGAIPSSSAVMNITITDKAGQSLVNNKRATALGQGAFNYSVTFPDVSNYKVQMFCTDGTYSYSNEGYYEITPSGSSSTSGQSINLIGSLILILLVSGVFFFIAHKSENSVSKVVFYTFSVVVLVMAILYTVVFMQQTLYGFENVLTGIETFWFVMKIGLTIGILAFAIVVFLIMLKAWKIKRGLYDVD